jgi:hypothetical protein
MIHIVEHIQNTDPRVKGALWVSYGNDSWKDGTEYLEIVFDNGITIKKSLMDLIDELYKNINK